MSEMVLSAVFWLAQAAGIVFALSGIGLAAGVL